MSATMTRAKKVAWFRRNPAEIVTRIFGDDLWSKQREIIKALWEHKRVAVQSCHGAGKTFLASRATAAHFVAHSPDLIVTTAPTWRQVDGLLWGELRKLYESSRINVAAEGPKLTPKWTISPTKRAIGFSADRPVSIQGWHERNGMLVCDEACGIDAPLWPSLDSLTSAGDWMELLIGNPDTRMSEFYQRCSNPRLGYHVIKISAFDTPNLTGEDVPPEVARALVNREYIERTIERHGDDSAIVRAKVYGEFPSEDADALIPSSWIDRAEERAQTHAQNVKPYMGLDIARQGSDSSVLWGIFGHVAKLMKQWRGLMSDDLVGHVRMVVSHRGCIAMMADADGMGGPVADFLRQANIPAHDFHGGATAPRPREQGETWCYNLRSAAFWALREALRDWLAIPKDRELREELESMQYGFGNVGKRVALMVEPKAKIKSRLNPQRSPDKADGLAYAVWAKVHESKMFGTVTSVNNWGAR